MVTRERTHAIQFRDEIYDEKHCLAPEPADLA